MSANLDLVRSIYADWERGDFSSIDWADPEIEFVIPDGPAPGRGTGVAALVAAWRDFLSVWEDYRYVADEFREIDDAQVLVPGHAVGGHGKASRVELGQVDRGRGANLFHIRAGRVAKLVLYWDRDRAFADLGLTPEGGE